MTYKYFPQTEEDIQEMLNKCGLKNLDELYAEIPEAIRFRHEYNLPDEKSEIEIRRFFNELGKSNQQLTCFTGAGVYDHYTPAVIPSLVERSEFLTSYTPYQAEISQGTLHYIFEYQTMMCNLTQMPISNACMYDGSTATAEAVMMASNASRKCHKVLISETIDPKIMLVIRTYAHFHGVELETIPAKDGVTSFEAMKAKLDEGGVAGVLVQQPNYFGIVEDYSGYADACHEKKALFLMNANPFDLSILKTPGEWGADVAVGDGQSLGVPMAWGGPYVGYMCCTKKLMRKMPGRIVGQTVDQDGKRCFVLTLQAREQHIRRQKATSNICSNESLMALWVTIYCSIMGKQGIKEAAQLSFNGAHYLEEKLVKTGHFKLVYEKPFFNEFLLSYDGDVDALQKRWEDNGFFGGLKVDEDKILFAVTEQRTKDEADRLVALVEA